MQDRQPTPGQEGRVLITPENGSPYYAVMEMADNPIRTGTPLNAANLLSDETAEQLGLNASDNPTPDDAFRSIYKVGDTKTTARTDLGEKWLLCNGALLLASEYPALWSKLSASLEWKNLVDLNGIATDPPNCVYPTYNNKVCILKIAFEQNYAYIYDPDTDSLTSVTIPTNVEMVAGVDWNGSQWVLGGFSSMSNYDLRVFTSNDLQTWTQIISVKPQTYLPNHNPQRAETRFLYDGTAYRFLCARQGYNAAYLHTITTTGELTSGSADYDSGYPIPRMVLGEDNLLCVNYRIYTSGSTSPSFSISDPDARKGTPFYAKKYAENSYFLVSQTKNTDSGVAMAFLNSGTSEVTYENFFVSEGQVNPCMVFSDTSAEEYVVIAYRTTSGEVYELRLAMDDDPTNSVNYKNEGISDVAVPESVMTGPDGGVYSLEFSPYEVKVISSTYKFLPLISQSNTYTYIKTEE